MEGQKTLFFLVGPTAVGKTEFGIRLAEYLGTEIVSADSMQIYRYMDIGTGKATPQQRARVPHHLLDMIHPAERYSVGHYRRDAEEVIRTLHSQGKIPVIVGGTGLYVRSLTDGLFEGPRADPALRENLKEIAFKEGLHALHLRLKTVDPDSAKKIHPHDERRLIRALEVFHLTGKPISRLQEEYRAGIQSRYRCILFGLSLSRNKLYSIIEERIDRMIEKGLVDEVRSLLAMGVRGDSISMQGLGYKEMVPVIRGERRLDEAITILKKETRHFAKRQFTWFSADPRIRWFDTGVFRSREEAISSFIQVAADAMRTEKS